MKKKRILLTRIFPDIAMQMLTEAGFDVSANKDDKPFDPAELVSKAKEHDAMLCSGTETIDKEFLRVCSHLDIIAQYGVGYNNIDIAEATRLKIAVSNTPDVLNDATADIAFGLMIAVARKMFYMHKSIIEGQWQYFVPMAHLGLELKNKTLGIFGLGRIGMDMARRCKGAYNMQIIYHNRSRNKSAEQQLNARYVEFDELLQQSDVISVHSFLSEKTRGIFDQKAFAKMKSEAIFINTSRGAIHDEKDLTEALKNKIIWGAGLDVTNPEPMQPDNPLLKMENTAILPHIGSATIIAREQMARMAASSIIEFYRDDYIPNLVNPDVLK